VTCDVTADSIVRDQYYLASKGGISLLESSLLPEFERIAFVNLIAAEIKKRTDSTISA
jgi:hypothetical protein